MSRTRAVLAVALSLSLTACGGGTSQGACSPGGEELREGDALPDCSFEMIDGSETVALASLTGQATVLNFWASWCLACIKEMPAIDAYAAAHPEIRVLGVNLLGPNGETAELGRSFFEGRGVDYDSIADPDGQLYDHFGSVERPIMPLTVIVDANGIVAARHFGELTEASLDDKVTEALS